MTTTSEVTMSGHLRLGSGEDLNSSIGRHRIPGVDPSHSEKDDTPAPSAAKSAAKDVPDDSPPLASTASDTQARREDACSFSSLIRTVALYAARSTRGRHAYLVATIRRLAIFADDEELRMSAPDRIIVAVQRFGYLLRERQLNALREWLDARGSCLPSPKVQPHVDEGLHSP
ncbi:MAG: hypothetical protein WCA32_19685 [Chromatiaceae bacterium]